MAERRASTESRPDPQAERLQRLRALIGVQSSPVAGTDRAQAGSTFDELLGSVGPGRMVDLLAGTCGSGAPLIGLWLAARACRQRGELVVIDAAGEFYPPAAVAWGVESRRLLWVRPSSAKHALAATEIALRSPAVGAVWASLERIDGRAFRRLLLAAEAANAFGVLVRSARYEADPSWADVQLRIDPAAAPNEPDASLCVRVTRRRNRHGPAGGEATLNLDWRTGSIEDVTHRNANDTPNPLSVAAGLAGAAKSA
jgi:hypothetical protein